MYVWVYSIIRSSKVFPIFPYSDKTKKFTWRKLIKVHYSFWATIPSSSSDMIFKASTNCWKHDFMPNINKYFVDQSVLYQLSNFSQTLWRSLTCNIRNVFWKTNLSYPLTCACPTRWTDYSWMKGSVIAIVFKYVNDQCSYYLNELFETVLENNIRTKESFQSLKCPLHKKALVWCKTPEKIKQTKSLNTFKHNLKANLFFLFSSFLALVNFSSKIKVQNIPLLFWADGEIIWVIGVNFEVIN